ncbi:SET domain-containing protein 9-like isoform X2 [Acanthaster planci]|uniref:SET domain-containing protein 9-like isoform X2 n=1 Tax=Acanthaster planci TaxID=133434 RepID=A0A8B7Z142_ACAPL|nr:SET domain-containing protein 9-like isoform X2 [Acanthaster planci]
MVKIVESFAKRWKQYKYRFVPWIALNFRKRKVRVVDSGKNDKILPDSKVELSLVQFFTGLSKQNNDSSNRDYIDKVQRSRQTNKVERDKGSHSAEFHEQCAACHYGFQTGGHMRQRRPKHVRQTDLVINCSFNMLQLLNQRTPALVLNLDCFLKCIHLRVILGCQYGCFGFGQTLIPRDQFGEDFVDGIIYQQTTTTDTKRLWIPREATPSRSFTNMTNGTSQNHIYQVPSVQGRRVGYNAGLDVMQRMLGFTIERQPSSIPGGGTGVFVTRGTIPAETVVAMYPGTVYKSWEPILLQSITNPFIFRCLDGTLIDGNDKDNEANVAYQEFDVPESFPFQLLRFIPNVFYSSTYQQDVSSGPRLMRTVVLVSLRDIHCGEELFSSYFTIVH